MSRFEVPSPSQNAQGVVAECVTRAIAADAPINWREALAAAYAVDVPAIVRREVAKCVEFLMGYRSGVEWRDTLAIAHSKYLASRFGETPEHRQPLPGPCTCKGLKHQPDCPLSPTPSAPAEPIHVNGCELDTDHKGPCMRRCIPEPGRAAPPSEAPASHCGMSNDGQDASRCTLPFAHSGPCQRPKSDGTTCAKCGEAVGHLTWCEYSRVSGCVAAARPEECGHRVSPVSPKCRKPKGHTEPCFSASCTACGCQQCQDDRIWVRTQRDAPYPKVIG